MLKCDFFYPCAPTKLPAESYHHNLDQYAYSSMSEVPTFSFGKNQSRDQASSMKAVVGILNARRKEEERLRKERMEVHTVGEYKLEESLRR